MKAFIRFVIVISLILPACNSSSKSGSFQTIEVNRLYRINLPQSFRPARDMHDFAELQYYDTQGTCYVIGIEDSKQKLSEVIQQRLKLDLYYDFVENIVLDKADSSYAKAFQEFETVQGLRVKAGDYYAKSEYWEKKHELFYRVAVYESDTYFFQLVSWMPYESHSSRLSMLDSVFHSFVLVEN